MKLPAPFHACRECAQIALLCLALVAAIWLVALERIDYERAQTIEYAVRHNANLALALEQQAAREIDAAESVLRFLKHEWEEDRQIVTLGTLDQGALRARAYTVLAVTDEHGYVRRPDGTPGPISMADRDYFRHHRDRPGDTVLVGVPVEGRVSGRMAIPVSLRITRADGSFGGVYFLGVDPTHFLAAYQRFDIGRDGLINLVGLDGISRARRYSDKVNFGDDMRGSSLLAHAGMMESGHFVSSGRLDGIVRFISYRTLPAHGMVVAVGTSVEETLAEFTRRRQTYFGAAAAATLLLAGFAVALINAFAHRRRATAELEASEALHRATFEKTAVGIAHHALDGRFLAANPAYCRMVGYSEAELRQKTFLDLLHPDERAAAIQGKDLLAAQGSDARPLFTETRHVRSDGTVICCAVSVTLARDARAGGDYLIVMAQDITDRKRAEEQLLEQLDELRRFEKVTVDRELRMIELEAELEALKRRIPA